MTLTVSSDKMRTPAHLCKSKDPCNFFTGASQACAQNALLWGFRAVAALNSAPCVKAAPRGQTAVAAGDPRGLAHTVTIPWPSDGHRGQTPDSEYLLRAHLVVGPVHARGCVARTCFQSQRKARRVPQRNNQMNSLRASREPPPSVTGSRRARRDFSRHSSRWYLATGGRGAGGESYNGLL